MSAAVTLPRVGGRRGRAAGLIAVLCTCGVAIPARAATATAATAPTRARPTSAGVAPVAMFPHATVLPGRYLFEPPLLAPAPFAIAPDRDGSLWVGSSQGLLHHDGEEVQSFDPKTQPVLRTSRVFHTVVGSDGSVWLGTGGGLWGERRESGERLGTGLRGAPGLYRMRGDVWRVYDERDGLPDGWVWSLATDGDTVWVGTETGLASVRNDHVVLYGAREGLTEGPVLTVEKGHGGTMLVGTPAGLYRLRGHQLHRELSGRAVVAVVQDGAGRTWAGTRAGLVLVRDGREVRVLRRADGLPDDDVNALVVDRQGRAWVGTAAGVCRMEQEAPVCLGVEHGLFDPRTTALAADREGGVWVGLRSGGLQRVVSSPVWNVGAPEGLPAMSASSVLAARDGSVWASTPGGMVRVTARGVTALPGALGGQGNQARSLAEGADGHLWVATTRKGLMRVSPSAPDQPMVVEDVPSLSVRSVFVDGVGDVWLGWAGGGLSHGKVAVVNQGDERDGEPERLRFEEIKTYGLGDGACFGEVAMGAQGKDGVRYFASYGGGVTVVGRGGVARCLSVRDGLPGSGVVAVHEDDEGSLWIGLDHDGGLVRYRAGVFQRLLESGGLLCDSIYEVADDGAGNLWITCGGGVQRLSKREVADYFAGKISSVSPLRFGERTGMRSQETAFWAKPVASLAADGHLWVATSAGLSAVEAPAHLPEPPPPVIAALFIDGAPRLPEPVVDARGAKFEIEARVRASGFPVRAGTRFRYRLAGWRDEWTETLGAGSIRFREVPPGSYRLEVLSGNRYGRWSQHPAVVGLELRRPFWRSPWFAVACAGAVALMVLVAYGLRIMRMRARERALQRERERIARDLHDGLGQGFAGISFHLEALREHLRDAPVTARELLDRARTILDRARVEARRSVWDLRGADALPLEAELAALAREHRASYGIPALRLELDVPRQAPRREAYVDQELLQIAKEALTNAVEHADARNVSVCLRQDDSGVELTVTDDGTGISPDVAARGRPGHFGIQGMRERARLLGAAIEVSSPDGKGTRVRVHVPLGHDELAAE